MCAICGDKTAIMCKVVPILALTTRGRGRWAGKSRGGQVQKKLEAMSEYSGHNEKKKMRIYENKDC